MATIVQRMIVEQNREEYKIEKIYKKRLFIYEQGRKETFDDPKGKSRSQLLQ